mgnify:CR=1 FL=1
MIHELRVYYCAPGKMPDLNKRFANVTLKLWDKHGIRQVGFWTVYLGANSNALYYMLEWDSLADRQKKWDAFEKIAPHYYLDDNSRCYYFNGTDEIVAAELLRLPEIDGALVGGASLDATAFAAIVAAAA